VEEVQYISRAFKDSIYTSGGGDVEGIEGVLKASAATSATRPLASDRRSLRRRLRESSTVADAKGGTD